MRAIALVLIGLATAWTAAAAECISMEQASQRIGSTACVQGTVFTVSELKGGNFNLGFCEKSSGCPFSVFVPSRYLRDVGDVRELKGKPVEIHGKIVQYRQHAEIVLKDVRQLRGEAAKIPPVPKAFDAARHGNYSAGKYSSPKSSGTKHGQPPAVAVPDAASP